MSEPLVVTNPAAGMMSLGAWGMPCRGPSHWPWLSSSSSRLACCLRSSGSCMATSAFTRGFTFSMRPRNASMVSRHDILRSRMAVDRATASRSQGLLDRELEMFIWEPEFFMLASLDSCTDCNNYNFFKGGLRFMQLVEEICRGNICRKLH